jgi:hypothetical protein
MLILVAVLAGQLPPNAVEVTVVSSAPAPDLELRAGDACWLYVPLDVVADETDVGVSKVELAIRYDPAVLQPVAVAGGFEHAPGDLGEATYGFRDTLRDSGPLRRLTITAAYEAPAKGEGLFIGLRLRCAGVGVTRIAADAVRGWTPEGKAVEGKLVQSNEVTVKVRQELRAVLKVTP